MKRSWKLVVLTLFVLIFVCGGWSVSVPGEQKRVNLSSSFVQNTLQDGCDWPSFSRTPDNNRVAPDGCGPKTDNLIKVWKFKAGGWIGSSPVVSGNMLYFGSDDFRVYCLNARTGRRIWEFQTGSYVMSTPTIFQNRVYVGSHDNKLYCLDAQNGNKIWESEVKGYIMSSPIISYSRIYVGSSNNRLYCFDLNNGAKIWEFQTGFLGSINSSPAIFDGKIYAGSYDKKLYCLDAKTGSKIWQYETGGWIESSPAISDGYVYFGSFDSRLYCLNAQTGQKIWDYMTGDEICSSPAVHSGKVYIGCKDSKLYCIDAKTGTGLWEYETKKDIKASPSLINNKIYIGSEDGIFYCIDAISGKKRWECEIGLVDYSATISGGYIYVGSFYDKELYCFGDLSLAPPKGTCCDNCTDCNKCMAFKVGSKDWFICNQLQTPMNTAPIIKNGRTFLVIRYIAETIGANVDWNATSQTVTITDPKNGKTIQLQINNNIATIGGKKVQIDQNTDVKPFISEGRTLLPLRFVVDSLGLDLDWLDQTKEAIICYKDPMCP